MTLLFRWPGIFSHSKCRAGGALPIEVEPRISEYLSLVMRLMFAFGLSFELRSFYCCRAGLMTADGFANGNTLFSLLSLPRYLDAARCNFAGVAGNSCDHAL